MLRPALVIALLLPGAVRAEHGRVQLSLYAGGGLSTDLFVGAGLGRDGMLELQPEARLDLSFTPEWKAASRVAAGYASFTRSGFAAGNLLGELEARWLGAGPQASLTAAAERLSYTTGAPLDLSTLTSPSITGSSALRLSPLLRWPRWGVEWRLAGLLGFQSSSAVDGSQVRERDLALVAGGSGALAGWALAASYRLQDTASDRPDFASLSHGLFATCGHRAGPVELEAQLQVLRRRTDAQQREWLWRASLSGAWPLGGGLALEAVYAFAAARSPDAAERRYASRHQATLGLRGKLEAAAW